MSKKDLKNVAASVRQHLLNLSRREGREHQLVLNQYGLERLLYRLSISPYAGLFVLKGAMLFNLWQPGMHRATYDLDLHGASDRGIAGFEQVFRDICRQTVSNDGLTFLEDTIVAEEIRQDQLYQGVRVNIQARLENARIQIHVDIGFGDAIVPAAEEAEFPTLLDMPAPRMKVYPRETVVAEKFHAVVTRGMINSRMKDFYDLWFLASEFDFDGATVSRAMRATFTRRTTPLPAETPGALTPEFAGDPMKQTQWAGFVRKGRLVRKTPDLADVISLLHDFLIPPARKAGADVDFTQQWPPGGPWR